MRLLFLFASSRSVPKAAELVEAAVARELDERT